MSISQSSLTDTAAAKSVLIHQISKHATQSPFRKTQGQVQRVAFHPQKPHFFAATQRYVRIYDLAAQKLVKSLQSGVKWISALDVHPGGDHLIIGSYDKKLCWFDLDLSNKPFRTLRYVKSRNEWSDTDVLDTILEPFDPYHTTQPYPYSPHLQMTVQSTFSTQQSTQILTRTP
jgi:WD40 repeat protein